MVEKKVRDLIADANDVAERLADLRRIDPHEIAVGIHDGKVVVVIGSEVNEYGSCAIMTVEQAEDFAEALDGVIGRLMIGEG